MDFLSLFIFVQTNNKTLLPALFSSTEGTSQFDLGMFILGPKIDFTKINI